MMYEISKPNKSIVGTVHLDGSKSFSNRVLIIQALCDQPFAVHNCSGSKDTTTLQHLLEQFKTTLEQPFDTGAAGTTFRFMTAFLALQKGTQVLTGSARMKQRPIGKLVEALRKLGCNIEYLEAEGFPPLQINSPNKLNNNVLSISADTSSQYISALLMVAPTLEKGLNLSLEGTIVSRPYIEMTLALMAYFGVAHTWHENTISIAPQAYKPAEITVEADWSAASYYYALAAFADDSLDLTLLGLFPESLQGDAVCTEIGTHFGIETTAVAGGIRLKKSGAQPTDFFEYDFMKCPDIAQTFAVVCAGLGIQGLFSGLETLAIKETDRVLALKTELGKLGVSFVKLPARFSQKTAVQYFSVEGKAAWEAPPVFATYEDHRMAMAFTPLAHFGPVRIEDPAVVAKSYPNFWRDLATLGFEITETA
jgi:3-phosphoshikimate 1-carboxyvinyltransferase